MEVTVFFFSFWPATAEQLVLFPLFFSPHHVLIHRYFPSFCDVVYCHIPSCILITL